jgi:hypothetical protein
MLAVGGADLDHLRLGGDLLLRECLYLRGIAVWISALRFIVRRPFCEEQFVVSGTLRAIHAAPGGGKELGIALVERCLFEQ